MMRRAPGALSGGGRRGGAASRGRRSHALLAERSSERPVPMARVRALVASGGVRVDGEVCGPPAGPLRVGQGVEALVRPELLRPARGGVGPAVRPHSRAPSSSATGLSSRWTSPRACPRTRRRTRARPSLVGHVEAYLRAEGRRGLPVGVHQRLDRDTSGIVLFAIDPRANEGLARAFEGREVEKTYLALTARPTALPPSRFRVSVPLAPPGRAGAAASGSAARTRSRPRRTSSFSRRSGRASRRGPATHRAQAPGASPPGPRGPAHPGRRDLRALARRPRPRG